MNPRIDWTGVVAHELAHCKRWDHITGLVAELTVCLLPWNPLMWLSKKYLIRLGEQACDDWVVATDQPTEDYAESLLRFRPQRQMAFLPAVVHSKKGLAGRVDRILKDSCGNPRTGTKWALATSLATLCLTLGVALAQTRPAEPASTEAQEKPPAKSLYETAEAGNVEEVKRLITEGADVNVIDQEDKMTPLCAAAGEGHAEVVRVLLANRAKVNMGDSYGYTPLYYAIWSNDEETVRTLVLRGADVKKHPPDEIDYYTPLVYAIWEDHARIVKTLLDAGADIHSKDESGFNPLYWAAVTSGKEVFDLILTKGDYEDTIYLAACRGQLERVKTLIEAGTDVNAKDEFGCTPLQWAVLADSPAVAEFLVAKGADVNVQDKNGFAPISVAPGRNTIQFLISQGADVNVKNTMNGATRLHNECAIGNTTTVECLLAAGADVNAKTKRGTTPLHRAALLGHKDTVKFLIERGANINASDNQGRTPLAMARQRKHTEVANILRQHGATDTVHAAVAVDDIEGVKRLLSEGADINAKDNVKYKYMTPLHVACQRGNKEIAQLLIENKADIEARDDRWGDTALHFAAVSGHKEIVKLLIEKGGDIEAMNGDGGSPLSLISGYGSIYTRDPRGQHEIIQLLIDKGANIETRSYWDCTPLYVAILQNRPAVAELLLEHGAKLNIMNRFWGTLADGAMRVNLPEMVRWSIEKGVDIPPLHKAAYFGETEKVRSLLNEGADVNQKDVAKFTALHCAVFGRNKEIVDLLIDNGANVEARTCGNQTSLYHACNLGYLEMAKLLVSKGADLNTRGSHRDEFSSDGSVDDRTSLHVASLAGHVEVVKYLLAQGADIQAKCTLGEEGLTPLHMAARNGRVDVVKFLLAKGATVNAKTDKGSTPLSLAQAQAQTRTLAEAQNYRAVIQLLREHGAKK